MTTENKLKLYRLADRLASFTIDNGPMGESRPFAREADELRRIAGDDNGVTHVHHHHTSEVEVRTYPESKEDKYFRLTY